MDKQLIFKARKAGKSIQLIAAVPKSDYDAAIAERDALAHRLNDVSIACKMSNAMIDETEAERDALAAQNKELGRLLAAAEKQTAQLTLIAIGELTIPDIEAGAGRAGFIAGASKWAAAVHPDYADDVTADIEADADQYAATVRKGGAE